MSIYSEPRPKRNFPNTAINRNDKIKKKINCDNHTYENNEEVEFDCSFKIKESNYNPEKECITVVQESNRRFCDVFNTEVINISIEEAKIKMMSGLCCVIDARDCRAFKNGHIKQAFLFNCQKRLMVLKAKKSWDMFEEKCQYNSIIIYNQKGEKNSLLQDFIEYLQKDVKGIFFLRGGYEEFFSCAEKEFIESDIPEENFDDHHFSPTNDSTKSTDILNATISEILPSIYIGNELDSKDLEVLKRKKITHILNVTTTVPFAYEGLFVYKRLSATDCNKQDMRAHYNEAFSFIDEAIEAKGKVLVHCWAGVSRSATIVAAYLLKHTELTVLQALYFLQSRRPIVEPNFNFLGQLERYYCDLERGVESRKVIPFKLVDDYLKKLVDIERVKDLSLSSDSSTNVSPISPKATSKPYFNFIK